MKKTNIQIIHRQATKDGMKDVSPRKIMSVDDSIVLKVGDKAFEFSAQKDGTVIIVNRKAAFSVVPIGMCCIQLKQLSPVNMAEVLLGESLPNK